MNIVILFLCFFATSLFAQESITEIRRSIKTVKEETEREKGLTAAEAKRHAAFIANSNQKKAVLEAQEKELQAQIDSLNSEVEKLKSARQKAINTAKYFENRKVKYNDSLANIIDTLGIFFANENLGEIASQLRKNVIGAEAAYSRAVEVLQEKIRSGSTAEVWTADGGKYFRFGNVSQIFVSQNGEKVLWLNTKTGDWQDAGENLALRSAIRETMRVAEGKTAPKRTLIPVASK